MGGIRFGMIGGCMGCEVSGCVCVGFEVSGVVCVVCRVWCVSEFECLSK